MKRSPDSSESNDLQPIELVADQQLMIEKRGAENVIKLMGADGTVSLSIVVTAEGPVLRFEGANLTIQSDARLNINARELVLRGEKSLCLLSDGDAYLGAAGDLHSEARTQNIAARHGNVNLKANDDVKLNGERILNNC